MFLVDGDYGQFKKMMETGAIGEFIKLAKERKRQIDVRNAGAQKSAAASKPKLK